ncbi:hypothetical protein HZS_1777 [Henneguya salminicola]|nr:hypothetical protein HZS_1777 [Henneguya salminicola]
MNSTIGVDDFFEGAEKVLEVWYNLSGKDLRSISRNDWDEILKIIGAKIMSTYSTDTMDSYVLSESSLFVWPDHFLIKTCGVTTLLSSYPLISQIIAKSYSLPELTQFYYSHKSFTRPDSQFYPHQTLDQEKKFLNQHFPNGNWHSFRHNDSKSEWSVFTYIAELKCARVGNDISTEIMMYGLSTNCLDIFSRNTYKNPELDMRVCSKMGDLLPAAVLDDVLFDPYGYSVNGNMCSTYFTIHVTPQPSCSYASFQTNLSSNDLISACLKVLDIFQPQNFCLSIVCVKKFKNVADEIISSLNSEFQFKTVQNTDSSQQLIHYAWF